MQNPLEKFKNKQYIRTFNFNMDVSSASIVIDSVGKAYDKLYLIGKNVCHSLVNTKNGIWKNDKFLNKYHLKDTKCLHDLLMVSEGLNFVQNNSSNILQYKEVQPINKGLQGTMTLWGSKIKDNSNIYAAIDWK